jgi:hypothetical protein
MGERHKGNNGEVVTDYIETNIQERKKPPKGSTRVNDVYLVRYVTLDTYPLRPW